MPQLQLGRRFAQVLAKCGAKVALTGRRVDRLEALAKEIRTEGGTCLPLALGRTARVVLPDVPAVAESLPGFEAVSFFGIATPAGVPKAVRDKLNREIARIITEPAMRDSLSKQGTDAVGNTEVAFTAFFKGEMTKWARVIKEAGIEAN